MNLLELKRAVDDAVEAATEYGEPLENISVSLQIDGPTDESIYSEEEVELHYDNDVQASGCVLTAFVDTPVGGTLQWILVEETDSPHGVPVFLWSEEWIDDDFNPTGIREGHFVEGDGYTSCGWDPCQDVFTTEERSTPTMWSFKIKPEN